MNHRHFSDFTENIVVAEMSYRLLHVLSFCNQEAVFVYIQDRGFSSFTDNMKRLSVN